MRNNRVRALPVMGESFNMRQKMFAYDHGDGSPPSSERMTCNRSGGSQSHFLLSSHLPTIFSPSFLLSYSPSFFSPSLAIFFPIFVSFFPLFPFHFSKRSLPLFHFIIPLALFPLFNQSQSPRVMECPKDTSITSPPIFPSVS